LRIISGKNKRRKIVAPSNLPVRPTTDMAKESLFNILNNQIDYSQTKVLDLFAGTGNISFEFASRGCPEIIAVDINKLCIAFIKQTAEKLDYPMLTALQSEYISFLSRTNRKWDLIFADPPYGMENTDKLPREIFNNGLLNADGILIIEHDKHLDFTSYKELFDHRKYGKVNFSFFKSTDEN